MTFHENVLVVGDFNFQADKHKPNDPDTRRFVQCVQLSQLDFGKFFTSSTDIKGHIVDIVLSRTRKLVRSITVENVYLSDHFFLMIGIDLSRPQVPRKVVKSEM